MGPRNVGEKVRGRLGGSEVAVVVVLKGRRDVRSVGVRGQGIARLACWSGLRGCRRVVRRRSLAGYAMSGRTVVTVFAAPRRDIRIRRANCSPWGGAARASCRQAEKCSLASLGTRGCGRASRSRSRSGGVWSDPGRRVSKDASQSVTTMSQLAEYFTPSRMAPLTLIQ